MSWSIVDTPSNVDNVIVSPSEINSFVIGQTGGTIYSIDIPGDLPGGTFPNGKIAKSTDNGVTWKLDATISLINANANLPAWDVAVAPDDDSFVVAVTDGTGAPNGPKQVFISDDGGDNWENTNFPALGATEYISCVHISMIYGSNRDILIGTRDGAGNGDIYILSVPGASGWKAQSLNQEVYAAKFSPNYISDSGIVVIASADFSSPNADTAAFIGIRDLSSSPATTNWISISGFPVEVRDRNSVSGLSPGNDEIITADIELPGDFLAQTAGMRRIFISTDADDSVHPTEPETGIFRIDDTVCYILFDTTAKFTISGERISDMAYRGDSGEGILLAGEVMTDATSGAVNIWTTSNPLEITPTWVKTDESQLDSSNKAPTGGGNSGLANAQAIWGIDDGSVYCGTSSANFLAGGTGWTINQWPRAQLNSYALDESAFSVSTNNGRIWNQLSWIDTELTLFSDVAVIETPQAHDLHDVIYLASLNTNGGVATSFDSLWRSTSDPLGQRWERILCMATSDAGTIVRVNNRNDTEDLYIDTRSTVVVFADRFTANVNYSSDEGQTWQDSTVLHPGVNVTDLTLANDTVMYILDAFNVRRGSLDVSIWTWGPITPTHLNTGHSISTPYKNPKLKSNEDEFEDWVFVGDAALGEVAYADFSQAPFEFVRVKGVPVQGNINVIADEKFYGNKIIYAASYDIAGTSGKIYRWTIDESSEWFKMEPLNTAFYGLAQRNDVLYGVWDVATVGAQVPGADRTLYPTAIEVQALEWDDLKSGLPLPADPNYPVTFTRDPKALKISTEGKNNRLWAIDNRNYDWTNKIGCLWVYIDNMAKVGPWTTAPYSGAYIPVDPATGRADEINFKWRQLSYALKYQLQISKDDIFSLTIVDNEDIEPIDPVSPTWILFPGFLEVNHKFYWRVRVTESVTGEIARSPWSAIMYFTTKPGLAVTTPYMGPQLLAPDNNCGCPCDAPVCFSWSPYHKATKYMFELSENYDMSSPIISTETNDTAYQNDHKLKCNTNYFWRVKAIEPSPSEWSAVFSFQTQEETKPGVVNKDGISTPWWILPIVIIAVFLFASILLLTLIPRSHPIREDAGSNQSHVYKEKRTSPFTRLLTTLSIKTKRQSNIKINRDIIRHTPIPEVVTDISNKIVQEDSPIQTPIVQEMKQEHDIEVAEENQSIKSASGKTNWTLTIRNFVVSIKVIIRKLRVNHFK